MLAARTPRSWHSRWRARSPICARWKLAVSRSMRRGDAIYFRLAADADQFLTMAKFRAARKLWARIETACGLTPKPASAHGRDRVADDDAARSIREYAATTIAVAAAGFGGADAVTVLPHTAPLGLPDAFARRVARNTQLVLLEEVEFGPRRRSRRWFRRDRDVDATPLRRGVGGLSGPRKSRRRVAGARNRISPALCCRGARRAPKSRCPRPGRFDRHECVSRYP